MFFSPQTLNLKKMHTFGSTIWRANYALYPLHEMICVLTFTPWPTESSVEKEMGVREYLILASLFFAGGTILWLRGTLLATVKAPISLRATFSLCMSTVCIQAQILREELLVEISKTLFFLLINIPNLSFVCSALCVHTVMYWSTLSSWYFTIF